jgi:hypothetical protein
MLPIKAEIGGKEKIGNKIANAFDGESIVRMNLYPRVYTNLLVTAVASAAGLLPRSAT